MPHNRKPARMTAEKNRLDLNAMPFIACVFFRNTICPFRNALQNYCFYLISPNKKRKVRPFLRTFHLFRQFVHIMSTLLRSPIATISRPSRDHHGRLCPVLLLPPSSFPFVASLRQPSSSLALLPHNCDNPRLSLLSHHCDNLPLHFCPIIATTLVFLFCPIIGTTSLLSRSSP